MIYGSITSSQQIIGGAGFANCGKIYSLNRLARAIQLHTTDQVNRVQSVPSGYFIGKAILPPIENGGIAGRCSFSADVSASIMAFGYIAGSATITISVSAHGDILINGAGVANFNVTAFCQIMSYGYMAGVANISAQPTAADIAGEFFAVNIDGNFSMRDILKILSSVAAGKTTIDDLGGGLATVTFRNLSDTTDAVVADMNDSARTNVTIDT